MVHSALTISEGTLARLYLCSFRDYFSVSDFSATHVRYFTSSPECVFHDSVRKANFIVRYNFSLFLSIFIYVFVALCLVFSLWDLILLSCLSRTVLYGVGFQVSVGLTRRCDLSFP